jgi:hypothetical protein
MVLERLQIRARVLLRPRRRLIADRRTGLQPLAMPAA